MYAQRTAQFETTIYVTDAVGNKDSVVVGYDPEATFDIDTEFGEKHIGLDSFDRILEVRSGIESGIVSKKMIIDASLASFSEGESCYYAAASIWLFIHAKHEPVTWSWKKEDFSQSKCRVGSFIVSHTAHELFDGLDYWWEVPGFYQYTCMGRNSTYSDTLYNQFQGVDAGTFLSAFTQNIDGELDTIYHKAVAFAPEGFTPWWTPCYQLRVSSDDLGKVGVINVSPNPTSDYLYISDELSEEYPNIQLSLYNISGQLIRHSGYDLGDGMDIGDLSAGIYFARIYDGTELLGVSKVIKM